MRAELRSLYSADAEVDAGGLEHFQPPDPRNFLIGVDAYVGMVGEEGEEYFGFSVVGVDWFRANPPGKGFRWGRAHLILDVWDLAVVKRAFSDLIANASGDTWDEIATKMNRYGHWEFDDLVSSPDD